MPVYNPMKVFQQFKEWLNPDLKCVRLGCEKEKVSYQGYPGTFLGKHYIIHQTTLRCKNCKKLTVETKHEIF